MVYIILKFLMSQKPAIYTFLNLECINCQQSTIHFNLPLDFLFCLWFNKGAVGSTVEELC